MPEHEAISKLYTSLQENNFTGLGTAENFSTTLEQPEKRKQLYDVLIENGYTGLGDFNNFESVLGKKELAQAAPQLPGDDFVLTPELIEKAQKAQTEVFDRIELMRAGKLEGMFTSKQKEYQSKEHQIFDVELRINVLSAEKEKILKEETVLIQTGITPSEESAKNVIRINTELTKLNEERLIAIDTGQGRVASAIGSFAQSAVGALADMSKTIAVIAKEYPLFNEYDDKEVEDLATYKVGKWLESAAEELLPTNPKFQEEFITSTLAGGAGSLLFFVLGGATGKALKMSSTGVVVTMASGSMAGAEYERAFEETGDRDKAFDAWLFNLAPGSIEAFPVMRFFRRLDKSTGGGVKKILAQGFRGGVEEGIQETIQQAWTNLNAQQIYDSQREILNGVGEGGTAGFILGFAMNAMGLSLRRRLRNPELSEKDRAIFKTALNEVTEKQKTVEGRELEYADFLETRKMAEPLRQKKSDIEKDLATKELNTTARTLLEDEVSSLESQIEEAVSEESSKDADKKVQETIEAEKTELSDVLKEGVTESTKEAIEGKLAEKEGKESKEAEKEREKLHHQIAESEENTTLDNMTKGGELIPEDFYTNPELYGDMKSQTYKESFEVIQKAKGNPEAEVTIYRSVPKGVKSIDKGDWVTLSKQYAKEHGLHPDDPSKDMPVIEMKVKVKDVMWDGNDMNELAYFPKEKPTEKTTLEKYTAATDEKYGYIQEPGKEKRDLTKEEFEAQEVEPKKEEAIEPEKAKPAEEKIKEEAEDIVEDKARKLKQKEAVSLLKEQKKDLLEQMNEAEDILWENQKGADREVLTKMYLEGTMGNPFTELKPEIIEKLKDAGYNIDSEGRIEFPILDDGVIKINYKGIIDATRAVKREFPTTVTKAKERKLPVAVKKKAIGRFETIEQAESSLQDAKDNLTQATRTGNKKLQKVFEEQLELEQAEYDSVISRKESLEESIKITEAGLKSKKLSTLDVQETLDAEKAELAELTETVAKKEPPEAQKPPKQEVTPKKEEKPVKPPEITPEAETFAEKLRTAADKLDDLEITDLPGLVLAPKMLKLGKDAIVASLRAGATVIEAVQKGVSAIRAALKKEGKTLSETDEKKFTDVLTKKIEDSIEKPKEETKAEEKEKIAEEELVFVDDNVSFITDVTESIKTFFQKNLTPKGLLPKTVFDQKVKMQGRTNAMLNEIKFTAKRFKKELRDAFDKPSKKQIAEIDRVLKGEGDINTLPEGLREVVQSMRNQIDALSQQMIRDGLIEGKLVGKIQENLGTYLTRSYEIHDNPKWRDKIPAEIKNKAVAYLRARNPELTKKELEGKINELLDAPDAPLQIVSSGKLGAKDLSILKKRKNIAPEIRALLGEYSDPLLNYARSITKMANLISKSSFLNEVKETGTGVFLFENPTGDFHRKITAEGSKIMEPLNGLYTKPEIAEAFENMDRATDLPAYFKFYMKVNGLVKYSKTILSLMTHVRNLVGNTGFAIMNGHYKAGKFAPAVMTTINQLGKIENAEFKKRYKRYQELGVVGESVRAGEIQDIIKDATKEDGDFERIMDNKVAKYLKSGKDLVNDLYQAEDDVWKIYAFENEMSRYKKAFPEMEQGELDTKVARIVRNTYPTYSLIPEAIKKLRRFPLAGTFVSFPAEVVRTTYNSIALAKAEIRDTETRSIGIQRMAGILTAATLTGAASIASALFYGITDDDDKAIRRYLPPWSKNSVLISQSSVKNGEYSYIDLGYSDPHSYLKSPVIAMIKGEDALESGIEGLKEFFEPFLGEELLAGRILDISRNKKKSGGTVYNTQAPIGDQMADITKHFAEALEPGTISSFRRIWKGINGTINQNGRKYDPVDEITALFTGQRTSTINVEQGFGFKAFRFSQDIREAKRIYNKVVFSKGKVSADDLEDAYVIANTSSENLFNEMVKDYKAAMLLGVSEEDLLNALKRSRINKDTRSAIQTGTYISIKKEGEKGTASPFGTLGLTKPSIAVSLPLDRP